MKGDLKIMNYFPVELKSLDDINEINFQSVISDVSFKRGAMISSGGYAGQNFYSIIASKLYDIKQKGFCFWAHRYGKATGALDSIYSFFNYEGEKYLLMTYTASKDYTGDNSLSIEDNESISEYYMRMWKKVKEDSKISYVKEYRYCNSDNYNEYPDKMFPEIIFNRNGKDSGIAYLISEFSYLTEYINLEDLCGLFKQTTQGKGESTICSYYKRPNHRLIELKEDYESLLPNEIKKTNAITYIIAKLKYPYIVALKG